MELHNACAGNRLDIVKKLLSFNSELINSQPVEEVQRERNVYREEEVQVGTVETGLLQSEGYSFEEPVYETRTVLVTESYIEKIRHSAPIYVAAQNGNIRIVKYLAGFLNCNLDIVNDDGDTPLHAACKHGHLDIVRYLLTKKCELNHQNKAGNTPLYTALNHIHLDIAKALLAETHCDVNCGRGSPLHPACTHGHLDIVKLLLKKPNCDMNIKDSNGNTPLHAACKHGHLDIVRYLLTKKCELNHQNKEGNTPLYTALRHEYFYIAEALLAVACDVNRGRGSYPLHLACTHGRLDIVELLLKKPSCDINIKDSNGDTPLHIACEKGHLVIASCLLKRKCDVNHQNEAGKTPLCTALSHKHSDIAKVLLTEARCDVNCGRGSYPLHFACKHGGLNNIIVELILGDPKCDMNIKNSDGNTPLHIACRGGDLRIVRALLATGKADPTIRNHHGQSPIEMTFEYTITKEVSLYAKKAHKLEKKNPLGSYVQVFVAGYASAGKTTLVEVLCCEAAALLKLVPKALPLNIRTFTDAQPHTPGIVPHELNSKEFGTVVIHDLAGQYEYYSSHAAVVENSVLTSAPLFVIVVDLSERNASIRKRLSYWLSFIKNHCKKAATPPHVTIVGSHKDVVKAKGGNVQEKLSIIQKALPMESKLSFTEPPAIALDCRDKASRGLSKLRSAMERSCLALREGQSVYFGCHILYGFLHRFQESAFTVKAILSQIKQMKGEDILLPQTVTGLLELLSPLNDKGLLLLLKNTSDPASSWVIFRKDELLCKVNGKLFAPDYKSTGVVSLSTITKEFPDYDPHVVIGFLTHLEFCQVLDGYAKSAIDTQMSSEQNFNGEEKYYLFPGLIKNERPQEHLWKVKNESVYCCGWTLRCTKTEELLESRFLHVLLLRLAFSFPLIPEEAPPAQGFIPAISRRCMMWKNGIRWLTGSGGIETIVEVLEENRMLVLMMNCREEQIDGCAKLRSEVIDEILKAKSEVCETISTKKSLINCSQLSFPLDSDKLSLFSIEELIDRVCRRTTTDAVDVDGVHKLPIEKLLGFEPYISIDQNIVRQVLSERNAHTCVPSKLLTELNENCSKYLHFHEHFKKYKGKRDLTFQTLRCEVFDKFSIFDTQFHKVSFSYALWAWF